MSAIHLSDLDFGWFRCMLTRYIRLSCQFSLFFFLPYFTLAYIRKMIELWLMPTTHLISNNLADDERCRCVVNECSLWVDVFAAAAANIECSLNEFLWKSFASDAMHSSVLQSVVYQLQLPIEFLCFGMPFIECIQRNHKSMVSC